MEPRRLREATRPGDMALRSGLGGLGEGVLLFGKREIVGWDNFRSW
jgi:hypothetical protein